MLFRDWLDGADPIVVGVGGEVLTRVSGYCTFRKNTSLRQFVMVDGSGMQPVVPQPGQTFCSSVRG